MQIERLFSIVYILLERKSVTAGELAERFGVSRRTILRDVEVLSAAGVPVYTSKGRGGGIAILDNYVLNKATISDEEQSQILTALKGAAPIGNTKLHEKLSALFQKNDTSWIEVDYSRWGDNGADSEKFELIKDAILERRAIAFAYPHPARETEMRSVYPLKLVFKSRAWYVQCYCLNKQDYRTFKLNRIQEAELLPESFAGRDFSPPPLDINTGVSANLVELELLFTPEAAYRIYDEFYGKEVQCRADGSFTIKVTMPEDYWLYGFLLSFGSSVRVISPSRVRENLLMYIDEMKKVHSEN